MSLLPWKRRSSLAALEAEIAEGAAVADIAAMFWSVAMSDPYSLHIKPEMVPAANRYGALLEQTSDFKTFYEAVDPYVGARPGYQGACSSLWVEILFEVVKGFIEAGKIHTAEDAITAMHYLCGDAWNGYATSIEGKLIQIALPLLTRAEDRVAFAAAIRTYSGKMLFYGALGFLPNKVFEEAVAAHAAKVAEAARETERRNAMGGL